MYCTTFVQCCVIHEQNLCAIFFNFIIVQKNCACENKYITGNVGNTNILLHNFVYIVQNIGTSWFADEGRVAQRPRLELIH